MKLDKIKFARVIAHCVSKGMSAGEYEVDTLDTLIDVDVPPQHIIPDTFVRDINNLMALMVEGKYKIEAIKLHRKLTGYGLKESKDEVEKHWPRGPLTTNAVAGKIMACFECNEDKAYDVAEQIVGLQK